MVEKSIKVILIFCPGLACKMGKVGITFCAWNAAEKKIHVTFKINEIKVKQNLHIVDLIFGIVYGNSLFKTCSMYLFVKICAFNRWTQFEMNSISTKSCVSDTCIIQGQSADPSLVSSVNTLAMLPDLAVNLSGSPGLHIAPLPATTDKRKNKLTIVFFLFWF